MITTGSKWFFGLGFACLVLAVAYSWTTGGNDLGPLTMGYKGGVGDHLGYGLLIGAAVISFFHGLVLTAVRDADPRAQAQLAGLEATPPAVRPAGISYWPIVSAFGLGLVLVGLVSAPMLFIFGLIVLAIVVVEWTVQTWADHATGDPATNRRIRNRFMNPVEYPVAGALAVAIVVVSISRVLLAVSEIGAVAVAGVVATLILIIGSLLAARPNLGSNVVVGLLLVLAVAVIGIGVAGGVAGERDIEPHHSEEEEREGARVLVEVNR